VTLERKLGGENPAITLEHKFNPVWNAARDEVVVKFDGITLLRCWDTPAGYSVEFLCQPAQYLLGAHWAVQNMIKQVFRVPLWLTFNRTTVCVGSLNEVSSLLYKGLVVDFTFRTAKQVTYDIPRKVNIQVQAVPTALLDKTVDHVKTCERLGFFDSAYQAPYFRLHETMGGDTAYSLLRRAILDGDYSSEFMELLNAVRNKLVPSTAIKAVEDMIQMHLNQLKAELCL